MIFIRTDETTGHRFINNGSDGDIHGDYMTDQYIAILMGWALGIDDES